MVRDLINLLPDNKILEMSKLGAFADGNFTVDQTVQFFLNGIENVGKGENAGYQHFLLFP